MKYYRKVSGSQRIVYTPKRANLAGERPVIREESFLVKQRAKSAIFDCCAYTVKCRITTFLPEVKDYTLFVQFSAGRTATLLVLYFRNGICYRRKTSYNRKRMNRSMTLYDELNFRLQREVGPFLKSGYIL